jgi:16S rRNA (cytidine1402-2'-O)-methyltransferase
MLYVIGTPIGNLGDITDRAKQVLVSVDLIACEDTRQTAVLLARYGIKTPTVSYHQHSSLQKIDWLVGQLAAGKDIAMVTDAGTPGISDPGGVLVEKVHEAGDIEIVAIPGPSSLTAALSISGLRTDTFLFLGFLPKKKGRQSLLKSLAALPKPLGIETVGFFESALRVNATLQDIAEYVPTIKTVVMGRELTKKFEEIWRGSLAEAIEKTSQPQKGEFVVLLSFR